MSKASKEPAPKQLVNNTSGNEEFKTKVFAKSGSPKTVKETFQLVLNLFLNLFS